MAMFDHRRVDWFETTIQLGFMVCIVTTVIIWIENRLKIGGHHLCKSLLNAYKFFQSVIQYNWHGTFDQGAYILFQPIQWFHNFFARACHIVRPNILGGSSHIATGQYLSFNLPITYMIYAIYMQCIYIYIHTFIYTCIYIYIYMQSSLFHFFWLSWTAVQRETQVRGTHEQCRVEKKTYIHIHIYITRLCVYICIHNMYEITPPIGDFYSAQGLI